MHNETCRDYGINNNDNDNDADDNSENVYHEFDENEYDLVWILLVIPDLSELVLGSLEIHETCISKEQTSS